jgi:ABC-type multidrug transport system ATPase subunit
MIISLEGLGKKFINQWIFKGIDHVVRQGHALAVTGPNGSGKSTLLKIISGWMLPTQGAVSYRFEGKAVPPDRYFRFIDYVAPYLELVEELSLIEFMDFHFTHKKLQPGLSVDAFLEMIFLEKEKNKFLKYFSSGMKQRLKLGLGFFSQSPILLLDEPTTNLDEKGKTWYVEQIQDLLDKKLIIIASNQEEDYSFANDVITLSDYTHV